MRGSVRTSGLPLHDIDEVVGLAGYFGHLRASLADLRVGRVLDLIDLLINVLHGRHVLLLLLQHLVVVVLLL